MKPFKIQAFAHIAITSLLACAPALALTHISEKELMEKADLVALGEVVGVDKGVETTQAQIRLAQVLKGSEAPGSIVAIESYGGKVYVDEDEPTWAQYKVGLYFLQKNEQGVYVCVNKADGQKHIFGENVFPYHENVTLGVPLKDYLKSLEAAVKANPKPVKQG